MEQTNQGSADCCTPQNDKPATHECCDTDSQSNNHSGHSNTNRFGTVTSATIHCLTGCIIGEVAGLAIGVSLGLAPMHTVMLAFALSYVSGFSLGLIPIMKRHGATFMQALNMIWIGEAISIFVMEVAMNLTDYHMGGMTVGSVFEPLFWGSLIVAALAGFIAAWPVNWVLIGRGLKNCH